MLRTIPIFLIFLVIFCLPGLSLGRIITVDDDAPADFANIQDAIDMASYGDTVMVHPGTYYENISFNGKNIILTSTDPNDQAIVESTIISSDIDEDPCTDNGSAVIFNGDENENCILSGFTVTGSKFGSSVSHGILGGSFANMAEATIENCLVTNHSGFGISCLSGEISHCNISRCQLSGIGDCTGAYIHDCTIADNECGILNCQYAIIQNCRVTSNLGVGIDFCWDCAIIDSIISGNGYGAGRRGGISMCSGFIGNNIIAGNYGQVGGGCNTCGVMIPGNSASFVNNTIIGNRAVSFAGGMYSCAGLITNCIFWGNESLSGAGQISDCEWPEFSCLEGSMGIGIGNIDDDPVFASPGYWNDNGTPGYWDDDVWVDGDFHLKSVSGRWDPSANDQAGGWMYDLNSSPCIDAGNPSHPVEDEPMPHANITNM